MKTHHDDMAILNQQLFKAILHCETLKKRVNALNVKIEKLELKLSKEK